MGNISARDAEYRRVMETASGRLAERIRAEREGRTAGTGQYVLGLR